MGEWEENEGWRSLSPCSCRQLLHSLIYHVSKLQVRGMGLQYQWHAGRSSSAVLSLAAAV